MAEAALNKLKDSIINGEPDAAKTATQKLLEDGANPMDIIKGMGKAMDAVGKKIRG